MKNSQSRICASECAQLVLLFACLAILALHQVEAAGSRGKEKESSSSAGVRTPRRSRTAEIESALGKLSIDEEQSEGQRSRGRSISRDDRSGSRASRNGSRSGSKSRSGSRDSRSGSRSTGERRELRSGKKAGGKSSAAASTSGTVSAASAQRTTTRQVDSFTVRGRVYKNVEQIAHNQITCTDIYRVKRKSEMFALKTGCGMMELDALLACRDKCKNVVNLIDYDRDKHICVMELGVATLQQAASHRHKFYGKSNREIRTALQDGLTQLHSHQYTHNDMAMPGNVMFFQKRNCLKKSYRLKIVDLGDAMPNSFEFEERKAEDFRMLGELYKELGI